MLAALVALALPVSGAPSVADLDVAVASEELVATEDDPVNVDLQVHAALQCTVGWDSPEPVRGTLRGFVRDGDDVHEFARAPLSAAWKDNGDGTYLIDQHVTFEVPTDHSAFVHGPNDVVVQFLPDQAREPQRSCQPDGYRVDPAEETFVVTVTDAEAQSLDAVEALQSDDRFHALPMVMALGLVALLALFAFRRQRRD